MPNGTSYTPGFRQSPEMLRTFVPVVLDEPIVVNHSLPSRRIRETQQRVSTLFTMVGQFRYPCCGGNGGRFFGSPRKPSQELMSAVSSPQM